MFHRATMAPPADQNVRAPVYFCHYFEIAQPERWPRLKIRLTLAGSVRLWINGRALPPPDPPREDVMQRALLPETVVIDAAGWIQTGQNLLSAEIRTLENDPVRWVFDLSLEALEQ